MSASVMAEVAAGSVRVIMGMAPVGWVDGE